MALRWTDRLSRRGRRRETVAFILSGGGPLGAIQVGFLRALLEEGIAPDLLLGSSVGAFNAAYMAENPTLAGAEELQRVWLRLRRDELFPGGRLITALNALKRGTHVYTNQGIRRMVEAELHARTFEELAVPTHVVATSLETGAEAWFSSGPLIEPILASAAMPGVFPPVAIDGSLYIDGGVSNNVPAARSVQLGARVVYVLNVSSMAQKRPLNRPYDFMMHGMVLARAQRYRNELERLRREVTVVDFPAIEVGHVAFTDLSRAERMIEAAYESGRAYLRGAAGPVQAGEGTSGPGGAG